MADEPKLSGTHVEGVAPADPSLIGKGAPSSLVQQRTAMFNQAVRRKADLAKALGTLQQDVDKLLEGAELINGRVDPGAVKAITQTVGKGAEATVKAITNTVRNSVGVAMDRSMLAQNAAFKELQIPGLSAKARQAILRKHMDSWMGEEFPPGSGVNLAMRLEKHKRLIEEKVGREVSSSLTRRGGIAGARKNVEQALVGRSPGATPVKGGSSLKQLHRLEVAEQTRKANDVAVDSMKVVGVAFGRWVLSPMHIWYGGREICEVLANQIPPETKLAMQRAGLNIQGMDLNGVYPLNQWPSYPHPFCKCIPVPFYPPELRAKLLESLVQIQRVGAFPDEMIAGSSIAKAEAKALAGAYNAVGTELGIVPVVTDDMAMALGNDGLGSAFAARVKASGKAKEVLARVRTALIDDVVVAEKRLEELRAKVTRELARLEKDVMVSAESREFIRARRVVELHREMLQFDANVRALVTLEDRLAKPLSGFIGTSVSSKPAIFQQMTKLGLQPEDVIVKTRKGKYWLEVNNQGARRIIPKAERQRGKRHTIQKIKDKAKLENGADPQLKKPKGVTAHIPGWGPFQLLPVQSAGMELIELEKEVLLHFGAGLGKTPLFISSISDLKAKGKIAKGLVVAHPPTRPQIVREVLKFNAKDRVTFYVPKSEVNKMQRVIRSGVYDDLLGHERVYKRGRKLEEYQRLAEKEAKVKKGRVKWKAGEKDNLRRFREDQKKWNKLEKRFAKPEMKKELKRLEAKAQRVKAGKAKWKEGEEDLWGAYKDHRSTGAPIKWEAGEAEKFRKMVDGVEEEVNRRIARVDFKPMLRDPEEMRAVMAADKNVFSVLGHDDIARHRHHMNQHFDYVAVDEVHNLTSPSLKGGSAKAEALKMMTGGKIKYKVGFTGTAARNSLAELWDIAEWLKPGRLPSKESFMFRYDGVTLQSSMFEKSAVKMLRNEIDDFVFTAPSPVKARLVNPFQPGTTAEEVDEVFRRIKMTKAQTDRAVKVDTRYGQLKRKFRSERDKVKKRAERVLAKDLEFQELPKGKQATRVAKEVKVWREGLEAELDTRRKLYERELKRMRIIDVESPEALAKIKAMSPVKRAAFKKLQKEVDQLNHFLNPESWRDNQHFLNIHNVDMKTSGKIQEAIKLVTEKLPREKIIIHVERSKSIEILQRELAKRGKRVLKFTGDMNMAKRQASLDAFNAGEADVLILSRAGSTGLNVQKVSHHTIHFDTPMTYTEYLQREARNWRNGQKQDVWSYMLHNPESALDRRRLEIFKRKKQVLEAVDELRNLTDKGNPIAHLDRLKKAGINKPSDMVLRKVRKDTNATLDKWCAEFKLLDLFTSTCPQDISPVVP